MAEKRMLVVPAELVKKIDENRGGLSQAEFLSFLIDNSLGWGVGSGALRHPRSLLRA